MRPPDFYQVTLATGTAEVRAARVARAGVYPDNWVTGTLSLLVNCTLIPGTWLLFDLVLFCPHRTHQLAPPCGYTRPSRDTG